MSKCEEPDFRLYTFVLRSQARPRLVGQVGVPGMAAVDDALRLAVLGHVREHQNLVVLGQQILAKNVRLQVTEAAAESDLLVRRQGLVAEDEEAVGVEGVAHPREIGIVDRPGQIQADDLRAEYGRERRDGEGHEQISDYVRTIIRPGGRNGRSEEHTSELQSLMRISYAGF